MIKRNILVKDNLRSVPQ